MSDEQGRFSISDVTPGTYKIVINFMGYETLTTKPFSVQTQQVDLGMIRLHPLDQLLEEVTVTGQRALLENKIDKLVYHADKDITSQGGDAGDVLRKVPMLQVDMEGNVSMRGGDVKVLINGKPSSITYSSVADAMKMIPADQIKSVEVITSPSAKYDAEGTTGIINIITKKTEANGLAGNVNLSAGTRSSGLNGGIDWRKGKFGLNAKANAMAFLPKNQSGYFSSRNFSDSALTLINEQQGAGVRKGSGVGASFGATYEPNETSTFSTNLRLDRFRNNRTGSRSVSNRQLIAAAPNTEEELSNYDRLTEENNITQSFDWAADYLKTFKKPQQELSLGFQWSNSQTNKDAQTEIREVFNSPSSLNRSFDEGNTRELTLQSDYVHPLSEKILLEFGAKVIERRIGSEPRYELLDPNSGNFIPDPLQSTPSFNYTQRVYAGYASANFTFAKGYAIKAGIRDERTDITWEFRDEMIPSTKSDYNNLVPSVTLSKTFADKSNLKASYSKRIQRPGFYTLNPYLDRTDPLNLSRGNPNLKPEQTDNFELNLMNYFGENTSLISTLYYRKTKDGIQEVTEFDGPVSMKTFENISGSITAGAGLNASTNLFEKLSLSANLNSYRFESEDPRYKNRSDVPFLSYSYSLNASWTLPKDYSLEGFSYYNSPQQTVQGSTGSFFMMNIGVRKGIFDGRGSLAMSVTNPFKHRITFGEDNKENYFEQSSRTTIPFRAFRMSFNYRFGKIDYAGKKPGKRSKGVQNDDTIQRSTGPTE